MVYENYAWKLVIEESRVVSLDFAILATDTWNILFFGHADTYQYGLCHFAWTQQHDCVIQHEFQQIYILKVIIGEYEDSYASHTLLF